jgi:predicted ATPase
MTELLLAQSREHGFFIWHAFGTAYQTALESASGNSRIKVALPNMGALLFETIATLNEKLADDAILKRGEQERGGWSIPELLRVSAKRRLQADKADPAQAETLLLKSLSFARRQGALSWELRSAITLAELWQSQNRYEAALELLASVRSRFTEGFTTADLIRSGSLLGELRSSV